MAQKDDVPSDVIDLGPASTQTQGPLLVKIDDIGGQYAFGMSDD